MTERSKFQLYRFSGVRMLMANQHCCTTLLRVPIIVSFSSFIPGSHDDLPAQSFFVRDTRITGEQRTESTEARKSEISGSTDGFDIGPGYTA
jgi:hypothetical protein